MEKPGKCECIYAFEKHYITWLFNIEIEKTEKILHKGSEKEKELQEKYPGLVFGWKAYLRDITAVRDRFEAVPTCKEA